MIYKELTLRALSPDGASTEIIYEIATARADRVDLLRIDIIYDECEISADIKKTLSQINKLLKDMKKNGNIHFFATPDSFTLGRTEAVFLQNKYPEHFVNMPEMEKGTYIYIKL